jgi:CubicO group peptidase (beta-lactamase class C family)
MRPALALLLVSVLASPLHAQPTPDFSELERTALDEMTSTGTPGMAFAVIRGNRVVFARGLGVANVETNVPVTPDTLFRVGSVTKMLTAAAVVTLAQEGSLSLDAPLSKRDKTLDPKLGRVTLDQLLSQTAGLPDSRGGDSHDHGDEALDRFVNWLPTRTFLLPPGMAFSYSNANYAVAGSLLTRVLGKAYADAMDEILFKPLGMTRTTLRPTVAMTYPLAVGHAISDLGKPSVIRPVADDSSLWPAGYAFSSVNDLSRFLIAVLNGGQVDGRQAMRSGVAGQLLTPRIPIPTNVFRNGAYGYGFFLQDDRGMRRAEHGGELPGYSAEVRMFPERRVAVVVLMNREGVRFNKTFDKAFDLLLGPKPKEEAPPPPAEVKMTPEEMVDYAGSYINSGHMELYVNDGRLFLSRGNDQLPVTRIGEHRFRVTPKEGRPQEFLIFPAAEGRPGYVQMFIWVYRKG